MENRKCWCPVTGREITAGMEDTKQNREICMNCPNHPQ